MKDPILLLLALLNISWGTTCIFFPQWYYKKVSPDQIAHDRRIWRGLGFLLIPLGLVLLATYVRR